MAGKGGWRFVAWGREEAARANELARRQEDAEREVRHRFAEDLASTRGPRRLALRLRLWRQVRAARRRVEREVAPEEGAY